MQIIVQRGLGDNPGADISSTILVTESAKLARGRQELDAAAPGRMNVALVCGSLLYCAPGKVVEMKDSERTDRGQLTYWSKTGMLVDRETESEWQLRTNLHIERLEDD